MRAIVCVPEDANPVKVESMRALGAEIVFHGRDFDDAREYCEKLAAEHGYRYIHSGNEPALIAGVGTYALEILEAQPDTEVIVVPVGGGSGAAGTCIVAKAVRPLDRGHRRPVGRRPGRVPILAGPGTGRGHAPARSRRDWRPAPRSSCRSGSCGELLDDFVLVSDDALAQATRTMIEKTRNLVEPAGAAALAAVLADPARFAGRKVVIICSGGNISPQQLLSLW